VTLVFVVVFLGNLCGFSQYQAAYFFTLILTPR
jgi:hypothetical protein